MTAIKETRRQDRQQNQLKQQDLFTTKTQFQFIGSGSTERS